MSTGAGNPGVQRGQIVQAARQSHLGPAHPHLQIRRRLQAPHRPRRQRLRQLPLRLVRLRWFVGCWRYHRRSLYRVPARLSRLHRSSAPPTIPPWTASATPRPSLARTTGRSRPTLTLNLGLRYELHPPLRETHSNTAAFLPDYTGPGTDGQPVNGAVVVSNSTGLASSVRLTSPPLSRPRPSSLPRRPAFPRALRYTDHTDFGPRLGFAWRPYGNDKTVLRGGWGRFIESPLGFSLVSGWAVHSSYVATYNQDFQSDGLTPLLSLLRPLQHRRRRQRHRHRGLLLRIPHPLRRPHRAAVEPDPRAGSRPQHRHAPLLHRQPRPGSRSHGRPQPGASPTPSVYAPCQPRPIFRPYPCWSIIQSVQNAAESNYHSGTVEVSRHSGKGVTFDASYT